MLLTQLAQGTDLGVDTIGCEQKYQLSEPANVKDTPVCADMIYELRPPDENFLKTYREDKDFDYRRELVNEGWLDKLLDRLRIFFSRNSPSFSTRFLPEWLIMPLKICVAIVVVFFICWFVRKKWISPFGRKEEHLLDSSPGIGERVDDVSYSSLLAKAVENKDYTLAVRIDYLYTLHLLNFRGIIRWGEYKTNLTYWSEIHDVHLKNKFRDLSRIFDYVCYGEFDVDTSVYHQIASQFNNFRKEVGE